jgi:hypothetical protein
LVFEEREREWMIKIKTEGKKRGEIETGKSKN